MKWRKWLLLWIGAEGPLHRRGPYARNWLVFNIKEKGVTTTNTTYYIIQHVANLSTCFPLELSRSGVPCKIQYHIWWPMIHILSYTRAKESSRSPGIHGWWSLDLIQACRPAAPSIGAQGVFLTFPRTVRCTRNFWKTERTLSFSLLNMCFLPTIWSSHRGGGDPVRTSDSYLEHPRVVLHWTNLDSKFPQIHKYIEKNRTNHNALLKREEIRMEYDLNILMQMVNSMGIRWLVFPNLEC